MTPRRIKIIGLFLVLALSTPSLHAQEAVTISATAALARLKAGNTRFAKDKLALRNLDTERRKELLKGQKPFAIILACADSRVAPEHIFDQGLGEIYVLRLEGNVAGPGIVGSIEYAVQTFGSPLIVVMGHEDCGAVKAAIEPGKPAAEPGDSEGHRGWLIRQIEPGKDLPKDPKEALPLGIKNNAMRQAQLLTEKSAVIKEFAQSNRVLIVPAVYSLATGKVDWLDLPKLTGKHPVLIRVTVPTAEARVWLDGVETKSKGKLRVFEVPPVAADQEFTYEIEAEWSEKGFKTKESKIVRFKGGTTVSVDFTPK